MELGHHSARINGDGRGWWACGTGRRGEEQGGRRSGRSARGRRQEALRSRSFREKFLRDTTGGRIPRPTPSVPPLRTDADYFKGSGGSLACRRCTPTSNWRPRGRWTEPSRGFHRRRAAAAVCQFQARGRGGRGGHGSRHDTVTVSSAVHLHPIVPC